ncbi:helix-turn-helix domain-containing protein [Xanthobacter autotrophicus]|uniref:helix-turn-helix domain-containing protein n=1 Tax=Xanthobacter autotrophicus TaxID=280 RepID=UPI0024A6843C|nr:helix-turn-helix domain-containing protein [Xanthobacter autotrophicus]MDI4655338.1 helix-turn-helix domain-containing protein [Xanthobacter autotrophicus]
MTEAIRALSRGLSALRILNETGGAPCQLVADKLGLSRPTVYRILETLVDCGLVSVDCNKVYCPTLATRALESGLTDDAWAVWIAMPALVELQKEVTWTCEIATFENYAMVLRDSTHQQNPYRIDVRTFDDRVRSMLTSAVGRAYLAFCPSQEAELILAHLERFGDRADPTARVRKHTRTALQTVITNGYALEQRSDYPRATVVAVPIRYGGRVLACIDIVWVSRAVELRDGLNQFLPALQRAQAKIEDSLEHYSPPTMVKKGDSGPPLA